MKCQSCEKIVHESYVICPYCEGYVDLSGRQVVGVACDSPACKTFVPPEFFHEHQWPSGKIQKFCPNCAYLYGVLKSEQKQVREDLVDAQAKYDPKRGGYCFPDERTTGVNAELRTKFMGKLRGSERFWGKAGWPCMFDENFRASIEGRTISSANDMEPWPVATDGFDFINAFKDKELFLRKIHDFAKQQGVQKVGVFPLNSYPTGPRVDGPYIHPINKMLTFTGRSNYNEKVNWVHSWSYDLSMGAFFTSLDAQWSVFSYGTGKLIFLSGKKFYLDFFEEWEEGVKYLA